MNYQQKMVTAIESAEKWQERVMHYEAEAEVEAINNIRAKRPRKERSKDVPMGPVLVSHIKEVLKTDIMYHRAVGNRNAQQTLAQMYGTAALVAAQYGDPAPPPLSRPLEELQCRPDAPHPSHDWSMNRESYHCPGARNEPCYEAKQGMLHKPHHWADIDGAWYCAGVKDA